MPIPATPASDSRPNEPKPPTFSANFIGIWHYPDPKHSWDKRLPQVIHRLHGDYGMPVELADSHLFEHHFLIAVPKHHARKAEDIISTDFSRP
jgi:hypothetical protein